MLQLQKYIFKLKESPEGQVEVHVPKKCQEPEVSFELYVPDKTFDLKFYHECIAQKVLLVLDIS